MLFFSQSVGDPSQISEVGVLIVLQHPDAGVADEFQLILVGCVDGFHQGGKTVSAAVRGELSLLPVRPREGQSHLFQSLIKAFFPISFIWNHCAVWASKHRPRCPIVDKPVNDRLNFWRDSYRAVSTGFCLSAADEAALLPIVSVDFQRQKLVGAET